jgi:hypothetical protein
MITHMSQLTYMAKYWYTYNLQLISMLEGHQPAQSHFLLYKIMVPRGNKPGDIQSRGPTPRPWSSLDRNCEIMRGWVGEAKSEQHHHTLTTPIDSDILGVSSTSIDSLHEWTTLTPSIEINSYIEPETEKWQPHAKLHHWSSSYPLCETLHIDATSRIKEISNLPSTIPILWSTRKCALHITVEHLRDFVSYGVETNDAIITLYFELLCTFASATYMNPAFLPKLRQLGWGYVSWYFMIAQYRYYLQKIDRPYKSGEPAIMIPPFIDGSHWVDLVQQ